MAQRKDLIAIAEMLFVQDNSTQNFDNKMDVEILQTIVMTLESLLIYDEAHHDPITGNQNKFLSYLIDKQFPDSLAFPKPIRDSQDLAKNSQIWKNLRTFNDTLKSDYSCRRQMIIARLDCTVESFKWKSSEIKKQAHLEANREKKYHEGEKSLNEKIHEKYDQARIGLAKEPQITISHLLALREIECDNILNSVVSSKNVDCQLVYKPTKQQRQDNAGQLVNLKQVIIPEVPDRGGRTCEMRMPNNETFSRQHGRQGGSKRPSLP